MKGFPILFSSETLTPPRLSHSLTVIDTLDCEQCRCDSTPAFVGRAPAHRASHPGSQKRGPLPCALWDLRWAPLEGAKHPPGVPLLQSPPPHAQAPGPYHLHTGSTSGTLCSVSGKILLLIFSPLCTSRDASSRSSSPIPSMGKWHEEDAACSRQVTGAISPTCRRALCVAVITSTRPSPFRSAAIGGGRTSLCSRDPVS